MFLWAAVFTGVAVLMAPTYILVSAQQRALADETQEASLQERFTEAKGELDVANELAAYLADDDGSVEFTHLVADIDALSGDRVTVVGYTYGIVEEKKRNRTILGLTGIAADRETLAIFKETVAGHEAVEAVDLPLASLAGDVDISFTMQLTLAADRGVDDK